MGIMTLVASLVWMGVAIYQGTQEPVELDVKPEMLVPLSPVINIETVEALVSRRQMGGNDWRILGRVVVQSEPVVEQSEPAVEATESAGASSSGVTQP